MKATSCPASPCATLIQPTVDGDLIDGVAAHLHVVHDVESRDAVKIARRHLEAK